MNPFSDSSQFIASGTSFTPGRAIKRKRERHQTPVQSSDNGLLMLLWFNKASKRHSLIHCQSHSSALSVCMYVCIMYIYSMCFILLPHYHYIITNWEHPKMQWKSRKAEKSCDVSHTRTVEDLMTTSVTSLPCSWINYINYRDKDCI